MRRPILLTLAALGAGVVLLGNTGLYGALTDTAGSGSNSITTGWLSAQRPAPVVSDDRMPAIVDWRYPVDPAGRRLALRCWGHGQPTVILDATAGQPGIDTWPGPTLAAGAHTRVCAYDRAGLGGSDPAPLRPRDLDDLTTDLAHLLHAAGLHAPVVLAGRGHGALIAYHYAAQHPADVTGLLLLDPPVPWLHKVLPAGTDQPDPEHLDRSSTLRQLVAATPDPHIPITVISPRLLPADEADYNPDDQKVWLAHSSRPAHIVVAGGPPSQLELPTRILAIALDQLTHSP
jgi:pimeloyl-ACP methyl ester carboxylesterase